MNTIEELRSDFEHAALAERLCESFGDATAAAECGELTDGMIAALRDLANAFDALDAQARRLRLPNEDAIIEARSIVAAGIDELADAYASRGQPITLIDFHYSLPYGVQYMLWTAAGTTVSVDFDQDMRPASADYLDLPAMIDEHGFWGLRGHVGSDGTWRWNGEGAAYGTSKQRLAALELSE